MQTSEIFNYPVGTKLYIYGSNEFFKPNRYLKYDTIKFATIIYDGTDYKLLGFKDLCFRDNCFYKSNLRSEEKEKIQRTYNLSDFGCFSIINHRTKINFDLYIEVELFKEQKCNHCDINCPHKELTNKICKFCEMISKC